MLAKSPGPETLTIMAGDSDLYGRRLRPVRKLRGKQTGDSGPFGSVMTEISTSLIPLDILDMCAYLLCCFPTIIFTGGSRARTKAAAHRHGKNPRHQVRQSRHHDSESEEEIVPVSKTRGKGTAQERQDEVRMLREEAAKRRRYDSITTIKKMHPAEYRVMRKQPFYTLPRTSRDPRFWRKEQELIYNEYYNNLSEKKPVCPQKVMDFEHLAKKAYFKDATWITDKMGLHRLMRIRENYSVQVVHQFFATVVFSDDDVGTMTWMTGEAQYISNFAKFAHVLGYPFQGIDAPCGARMHEGHLTYDVKKLKPLYYKGGFAGQAKNLQLTFNILLCMFRECIYPQAGNLDDIRGALVNLVRHAYEVAKKGPDGSPAPIDVMNFIYEELLIHTQSKKVPLYAPYVMKLLGFFPSPQVVC